MPNDRLLHFMAQLPLRSKKTTSLELRGTKRCQVAKRAATDIEGHSAAAQFSQPGRLNVRKSMWRLTPEKYRGASRRADRHQRMRIPPVSIAVFLHFVVTPSLKIVWVARSDQVQLPSAADSPQAQHRLRRELAVEVLRHWLLPFARHRPYRQTYRPTLNCLGRH
jgi:hypothetical protein